jgi:hypothetical protein
MGSGLRGRETMELGGGGHGSKQDEQRADLLGRNGEKQYPADI